MKQHNETALSKITQTFLVGKYSEMEIKDLTEVFWLENILKWQYTTSVIVILNRKRKQYLLVQ